MLFRSSFLSLSRMLITESENRLLHSLICRLVFIKFLLVVSTTGQSCG